MTNIIQFKRLKPSSELSIPRMDGPIEDKNWYLSTVARGIEFAVLITQDRLLAEMMLKRFIEAVRNNRGDCEFTDTEMAQIYHYVNATSPFYHLMTQKLQRYFEEDVLYEDS